MKYYTKPHRRHNILTGEWILVSPHRAKRPWCGQKESINKEKRAQYEQNCYLCPGNTRVSGEKNPHYHSTYAFTNDHAALTCESESPSHQSEDNLFFAQAASGTARVLCFSPHHDLSLAQMSNEEIIAVIHMWQEQTADLGQQYQWVQLFENKGAVMGCSAPHPHGQVWASSFLPTEIMKEDDNQRRYFAKQQKALLLNYAKQESKRGERTVCENNDWIVVVPYWATWPYETLLLPKFAVQRITDLTAEQCYSLSTIIKSLLVKYDKLFNCSFPYSMGWHGAPFNDCDNRHWQLHAHYYPPLLRSATVKKFMVGYEMLAESQRDLTPEQAAKGLKDL